MTRHPGTAQYHAGARPMVTSETQANPPPQRARPGSPSRCTNVAENAEKNNPPTPNNITSDPAALRDRSNLWCKWEAIKAKAPSRNTPCRNTVMSTTHDHRLAKTWANSDTICGSTGPSVFLVS